MTIQEKTPLQAVVCVVCDALCDLPIEDRARALDAVHVTLGMPVDGHRIVDDPDPERMMSSDLTFATKHDTQDLQHRADVVIDLRSGTVTKNRFGRCTPRQG
jgi:hypothetical protein